MKMEEYIQVLTDHVLALSPNYGDGDSLLTMRMKPTLIPTVWTMTQSSAILRNCTAP